MRHFVKKFILISRSFKLRAAVGTIVNDHKETSGSLNMLKFKHFLSSIKRSLYTDLQWNRAQCCSYSEMSELQSLENELNYSVFKETIHTSE